MKWPLLILLACAPAWAYPPIFQADVPDPEAITCLYENSTAGHVEQFPVTVSAERGNSAFGYRVCLRSALDWPVGPNSVRVATRAADGRTTDYTVAVLPRPSGSVSSARLRRDAAVPPPDPEPDMTTKNEDFSGTLSEYTQLHSTSAAITGGVLRGVGSAETGIFHSSGTYGNDHSSQFVVAGAVNDLHYYYTAGVRYVYTAASNFTGYRGTIGGGGDYYLSRVTGGAGTDIVSGSIGRSLVAGDVILFTAVGTTMTLKLNGTTVDSFSDATYASGKPGLELYDDADVDNAVFADVGGSTVTAVTSLSAAIQLGRTAAPSLSAAVQAGRSASTELSASVQQGRAATASISAAAQRLATASTSLDAAVQAARTAASAVDAAVQASGAQTASVDAVVQRVEQATLTLSAAVQAANVATLSINGYVQSESAASSALDAAVLYPRDTSLSLSAGVQLAQQASAALEAAVQEMGEAAVSINAQVQAGTTASSDLNAAVEELREASASVSGAVQQVRAASSELSAAVSTAQVLSTALSAAAQTSAECSAALSAYVSIPSSGECPSADEIAAAVLAALNTNLIPVNVKQMNDADVIGDGTEADMWRGVGVPP